MTEETQQERLERIERHVIAPVLSDSCRPKWLDTEVDNDRWIVTYKPNRDKPIDNVHQYKFMKSFKSKPSTYFIVHSDIIFARDVAKRIKIKLKRINGVQIGIFLYFLFPYSMLFLFKFFLCK